MKYLFPELTLLVTLFAAHALRADETDEQKELREVEKNSAAALVKGDLTALEQIFAEDCMIVDAAGHTESRDVVFKALRAADLKFTAYELGPMEVRVYAHNTAVVVGRGHPKGEWRGEKFEEDEVYSDTFIRVDGKWRCILSHSATLPDAAK